jgi:hypothetical protein
MGPDEAVHTRSPPSILAPREDGVRPNPPTIRGVFPWGDDDQVGGSRTGTMPWRVVERKIGRAGGVQQRTARQREWDARYGEDNWEVGYLIDGEFVTQAEAVESVYDRSYEEHFDAHPEDLEELVATAKRLRNPHSEATTGVDLQVPAILTYLERHGLALRGEEVVDIGSWEGRASHPLSIRLSPLTIRAAGEPKLTLEQFWQRKKCLAVWDEEGVGGTTA